MALGLVFSSSAPCRWGLGGMRAEGGGGQGKASHRPATFLGIGAPNHAMRCVRDTPKKLHMTGGEARACRQRLEVPLEGSKKAQKRVETHHEGVWRNGNRHSIICQQVFKGRTQMEHDGT